MEGDNTPPNLTSVTLAGVCWNNRPIWRGLCGVLTCIVSYCTVLSPCRACPIFLPTLSYSDIDSFSLTINVYKARLFSLIYANLILIMPAVHVPVQALLELQESVE